MNSGTYRFLQVSFHRLTRKPVEWQYVLNLNCCLPLLQKFKDALSQIIRSLWKGRNNKIRFQTKDDFIARLGSNREETIIWNYTETVKRLDWYICMQRYVIIYVVCSSVSIQSIVKHFCFLPVMTVKDAWQRKIYKTKDDWNFLRPEGTGRYTEELL